MANEFIELLRPKDFFRLNGSNLANDMVQRGSLGLLRLLKSDLVGFTALFIINAEHTVGTGITLQLGVVDDGADAADLGKVVRIGVTAKLMSTGADTLDIATSAATEQTVDVTLDSTTGELVASALAIANAALDSAVAGSLVLIRVRRIGSHANDTCQGTACLSHVYIRNT